MTGNYQLDSFIAAVLVGGSFAVLYAAGIFIYRILFTKNQDEYPVKYYGKNKQRQTKGTQDIVPAEPDQYADIIDDYPTYNRQVENR